MAATQSIRLFKSFKLIFKKEDDEKKFIEDIESVADNKNDSE